jgi:hypothetical protein
MRIFLQIAQKAILTLIAFSGSFSTTFAQNWDQIIKANAGDRESHPSGTRSTTDLYGRSVSISGNYAIVGASFEELDENGQNDITYAGAVFILNYNDGKWKQVQKICASVRSYGSYFGQSVAINEDYIIVGAPGESGSGAAYIFKKNQNDDGAWGLVKRITAAFPGQEDAFGKSVSISGDYAVVGAEGESEDALEINNKKFSGSAYIFKKDQFGTNNWGQLKKLTASDRNAYNYFGTSVVIEGDYILVGAPLHDVANKSHAGSAYVFRKDNGGTDKWNQSDILSAPSPLVEGKFGTSISKNGDNVVIGAYADSGKGAAYIFQRHFGSFEYWTCAMKLIPTNASNAAAFGNTVAITDRYIMVGAPNDAFDEQGANEILNAGSVYIYEIAFGYSDKWDFKKKVTAPVRTSSEFGYAVSLFESQTNENISIVGAPFENITDPTLIQDAGSAYIISKKQLKGDVWKYEQTVAMQERSPDDNFGYSVSISGNYAIVGAPFDDEDGLGIHSLVDAGSAYIFHNNAGTWSQIRKISATTRSAYDNFGTSVFISGSFAIVGAPNANTNAIEEGYLENAGAAYIFQMDQGGAGNWGQVKKLTALNRKAQDQFGSSVATTENDAVVGAPGTDGATPFNNYGSAYTFSKNQGGAGTWGAVKELTASIRHDDASFGRSVSISAGTMIIGAYGDYDGSPSPVQSGAAYIFKKARSVQNDWLLVKKLLGSASAFVDLFGCSVSISGDYAIVGAYAEDENTSETDTKSAAGSAFIYKKDLGGTDNWGLVKKIVASDRASDDHFGWSVSISGTYAIVGAPAEDESALSDNKLDQSGSVYIFKKDQGGTDSWGQIQKTTASVREAGDEFGRTVALSELYAIVGSPFNQTDAAEQNILNGAGSVYIFHTNESSLPVKLATFTADKTENQAVLKWTTTAETNSDFFEIERSFDARKWESAGTVSAATESSEKLSYEFTDRNILKGAILYRLKMVDKDGTFAYSRIRSLTFGEAKGISVYPNPVIERIYISSENLPEVESIRVINAMGQVVAASSKVTDEGMTVGHLSAGIYIIQIRKTDGRMQAEKVAVVK